jgi:CheY-like chemotaxis protein
VLVVDDDPSVRELYRSMFVEEGYRVESAVDGQDALDRLQSEPDLIVLDLAMPWMDGHEFLRRLAGLPARARVPVLVVSAQLRGPKPEGATAVMRKPFEMDALLGEVARMLTLAG